MAIPAEIRSRLALKFEVVLPHLNERQQRLVLAAEARLLGHGGVRAVAQAAGVGETTVRKGVFELEGGQDRGRPIASGDRAGAENLPRTRTHSWCRLCWRWWSLMSAGIR
jgi:hypothetical protein